MKGNVPGGVGVVKLTPEQQDDLIEEFPICCEPVPGAWGRRGYTRLLLRTAPPTAVRRSLRLAWCNVSGKSAVKPPPRHKRSTRPSPK